MSTSQTTAAHVETNAQHPDRTPNGRFKTGNAGGPGNPFGRQLAQFRQALLSALTVDHLRRIGAMLIEKTLDGNLAAAKLLLQYAVGKPQVVTEPDRVDIDEWALACQSVVRNDIAEETFASMPITVGIATVPALAEVRERQFADMMLHPEKYPIPSASDEPTEEELAEELALQREYMAAQAAEEAASRRHAAASPDSQPAQPMAPAATTPAAAKTPTAARQRAANGQHSNPRSQSAAATDAAREVAAAPSPNGTQGAPPRRAPSAGDASGRQKLRPAG